MIKDDMNKEIYQMVFWSDVILLGTPVYWGTPSAQIKTFMDRFNPFTHGPATELRGAMDRKVVGAIATSLDVHGGTEISIQCIHHWAHVLGATVATAGPHHPHGAYLGGAVHTQPYWGPDMWKYDIFGTRSVHGVAQRAVELATYLKLGEQKAKEMGEDLFKPNLEPPKDSKIDWDEYFKISPHMPTVHYSVPGVCATSKECFNKYIEWMDPKNLKERKGEAFAESSHAYLDPKKFEENWKKLNVKFITDDELLQIDPEYFGHWKK
jgi:multimeric flavodoxin WrbA